MNVGILLITHDNIGAVLLRTAIEVLGICPLSTGTLAAPSSCDPERILEDARHRDMLFDRQYIVLLLPPPVYR